MSAIAEMIDHFLVILERKNDELFELDRLYAAQRALMANINSGEYGAVMEGLEIQNRDLKERAEGLEKELAKPKPPNGNGSDDSFS